MNRIVMLVNTIFKKVRNETIFKEMIWFQLLSLGKVR